MSTPEITVTLGRSSQIVKRKRTDFDKFAEAPVNATGLLNSLGLGKYAIHFEAEEGPRKKIIQALSALFKRLSRATVVR